MRRFTEPAARHRRPHAPREEVPHAEREVYGGALLAQKNYRGLFSPDHWKRPFWTAIMPKVDRQVGPASRRSSRSQNRERLADLPTGETPVPPAGPTCRFRSSTGVITFVPGRAEIRRHQ